jgi:hypothetical protein
MPESYSTGPSRVIIRHKGPAGKGLPPGGTPGQVLVKSSANDHETEWVEPPDGTDAVVFNGTTPANNELVIFDGTTGKLVKRSSISTSSLAFVGDLDNKVDKVMGKDLSTNDFTDLLETKLTNLPVAGFFRGNFTNIAAVNAFSFAPVPAVGDYVTVAGPAFARYWWNPNGTPAWVVESEPYTPDAAALADILFDDGDTWTLAGNIMFTPTLKAQIEEHQTIIDNLGLGPTSSLPKGQASYFNLTGQVIDITAISDSTNNFVLVNVPTSVAGAGVSFTGGEFSLGRLEYTGLVTRTFLVQAALSYTGALSNNIIIAVAKNGTILSNSRVISAIKAAGEVQQSVSDVLVSLTTGDYVEVFVANSDSTDDITVKSLNFFATAV